MKYVKVIYRNWWEKYNFSDKNNYKKYFENVLKLLLLLLCYYYCSVAQSCLTLCHLMDFTIFRSLCKLMSTELVMPSNHLILCHPFSSCPQSFPASGSFPMSLFLTSAGQSTGTSVSTSILPMNIQGWFPVGLTGSPGKNTGVGWRSPGDLPNPGIQTPVSHIAGRFFTIWATREAPKLLLVCYYLICLFFFFNEDHFKSLNWTCCNITCPNL